MIRSYAMHDHARRVGALLQAIVLAGAALVPIVLLTSSASADQLQNRYIDMSATQASEGSGRDGTDGFGQNVTYTVKFDLAQAHTNLEGIVVQFCSNSPLIGTACTQANGSIGFDLSSPTLTANTLGGATDVDPSGWTVGGDADTFFLTDATGIAGAIGDTVAFDIDGITNPTSAGSFYARILTYTDSTTALAYAAGTPGANVDEGGIALAVTNELTVTARVQEILEFCVGSNDANTAGDSTDDCTDITGTDVDLGVVDASAVNTTTGTPAFAMVRTNGFNGASVYYKAEQDNGDGKLKISGATCTNNTSELDQCFNSAIGSGTTAAPVGQVIDTTTSGEAFGMTLISVSTENGGATTNLSRDAAYDGDGTTGAGCTAADAGTDEPCWAWADSGVFDTIASSSSVIDDEMVRIAFAAVAAPTTPTGLYTTTANFVATATF